MNGVITANEQNVIIAMVAGEASGDTLGAGLMAALMKHLPNARFIGIGGPKMLALGFNSLYSQERLAVMGLVEPLKRLPELLSIRHSLAKAFIRERCDVFVGIDSPDFNLGLARKLKQNNIRTMHYVSPSVWAWRQGRMKTIASAIDHMMTLFPFESLIYHKHGVPVSVVGHTLADQLPLKADTQARTKLCSRYQLDPRKRTVGLLPGSRKGEIRYIAPLMIEAAALLLGQQASWQFLIPAATPALGDQLRELLKAYPALPIHIVDGQAQRIMAGSDALIMASGTATLEAMLLKKPMVVIYKMHPWSFKLMKRMATIDYVSLPNLLAQAPLVPELLQDDASSEAISVALKKQLSADKQKTIEAFTHIHKSLRLGANERAALAVIAQMGVKRIV